MAGDTGIDTGRVLLERDRYLTELENAFTGVSERTGSVVLISGEAGIGKTSLVENFTSKVAGKARILWGNCDALFTPRPLGPLYDIAGQLKDGLLNLLNTQAQRPVIFSQFIQELRESNRPGIVVIEDVHWADESTLDLIKFLGRRVNTIHTMVIITYRDDEIRSSHPLRLVLGDIPSRNIIRLKLPPLTEETVNRLASSRGIDKLFEITRGNPFLISELLSNRDERIPASIKDSILTRISRLSGPARDFIELVSIVPTRAEQWLIEEIMPPDPEITGECFNSGMLKFEDGTISFKHELSRMAVEASLDEPKIQSLNERVLRVLLDRENIDLFLARIIHHAAKAQNREVIIRYASEAAKQASMLGAHSLAAGHYQNAMKYIDDLPLKKRIELYEGRSYECYLTGKVEGAIRDGETVLELLKKAPDPMHEAKNYRRMSRMLWYDCKDEKGEEYLNRAIEILEKLPVSYELAMAYSNKSQTYMLREKNELAIQWGEKAVEFARQLNNMNIEAHALNNIGTSKMFMDNDSGEDDLKRSLELSLKNNFYEHAARAYINLGSVMLQRKRLAEADHYFSAGNEYCLEKDLLTLSLCMAGHQASTKLYLGNWDEAIETAGVVFKKTSIPPGNKIIPLLVTGLIRARRSDPGVTDLINEANKLAHEIGETEKIVLAKTIKAEIFWLHDKLDSIIDEIAPVYNHLKLYANSWEVGSLAYWLWRGNRLSEIPGNIAQPYLMQIKGEWEAAAELWEELNCPYEQAMALIDGDETAMKKALDIFARLGASAAVELTKQKMRAAGIKRIPKGPRKTTRKNPAGLTARQLDILELLSKGLSNVEIGSRLFISPKTVDHHISAILGKLNVRSRLEAAAYAHSHALLVKK